MLSQETMNIINSTAPVLEIHGKEITTVFYSVNLHKSPTIITQLIIVG